MSKRFRLSTLLIAVGLSACGGEGTAPSATVQTGGPPLLLGSLPIFVQVLERTASLPSTYTASATIGTAGGTIAIPEAGFRIDFPAGAVSGPVSISVKALAGRNVAYEFAPHGLRFARTPVITQDLRGTAAYGASSVYSGLEGAYAPDLLGLVGGLLRVLETRPTTVQPDTWQMRWTVQHFSGYVAAKRRTGYISATGNLIPFEN